MADLPRMILTNDDGIDAPGLAALRAATRDLPFDRRVFAPMAEQSSKGHAITTHAPIAIGGGAGPEVAVGGTPADCVRVGLHRLGPEVAWVVAGINHGGNLGVDVHYSGTVAAVREATFRGVPGIAISHYVARGRAVDWDLAADRANRVLRILLDRPPVPGWFWNVNLPHPEAGGPEPKVAFCQVDPSPLGLGFEPEGDGVRFRADYQQRPRIAGQDVEICFGGRITISLVRTIESVAVEDWTRPGHSGIIDR